jgi:UDP-N-acetylglucosamine pyrophosphorylase
MSAEEAKKWMGILESNNELWDEETTAAAKAFGKAGQAHLFSKWKGPGQKDKDKKRFMAEAKDFNEGYTGGIAAYTKKFKKLAKTHNKNPLAAFAAVMPDGFSLGDSPEDSKIRGDVEAKGLSAIGNLAFVLQCHGSGRNVGCKDPTCLLPLEVTTEISLLEHSIKKVLALQEYANTHPESGEGDGPFVLHIALVVDYSATEEVNAALEEHNWFGAARSQITVIVNTPVVRMRDLAGTFAVENNDPFRLDMDIQGDGQCHEVLHTTGLVEAWMKAGVKHIFFGSVLPLNLENVPLLLGACVQEDWGCAHLCHARQNDSGPVLAELSQKEA